MGSSSAVVVPQDGVSGAGSDGSAGSDFSGELYEVATDDMSCVLQFSVDRDPVTGATTLTGHGTVGLADGTSAEATVVITIGEDGIEVDVTVHGDDLTDAQIEEVTRRVLAETAEDLYAAHAINVEEHSNLLGASGTDATTSEITREPGNPVLFTMDFAHSEQSTSTEDAGSASRDMTTPAGPVTSAQSGAASAGGSDDQGVAAVESTGGDSGGGGGAAVADSSSGDDSSSGTPGDGDGGGGGGGGAGGTTTSGTTASGTTAGGTTAGGTTASGTTASGTTASGAAAPVGKNFVAKGTNGDFEYASQGNKPGEYFFTTPEGHVHAVVSTSDRIPGFWNGNRAEIAFNQRFTGSDRNGFSSWFHVQGGQGFSVFQLFNNGGDQFPEVMLMVNDKGELIIGGRALGGNNQVNLGQMPADGVFGVEFTHNGDGTFSITVLGGSPDAPVVLGSATGKLTLPSGTMHYRAGPYFNGYNNKQFEPGKNVTADVVIINPHMTQY